MTPLALLLICLGIFIAFAIVHQLGLKPPKPDGFDQLDTMEAEQGTKEDGWIADLEALIAEQKANLAFLRTFPPTLDNLDARGQAVVSIGSAERVLAKLRARKQPNDRRESAAVHFEGRM